MSLGTEIQFKHIFLLTQSLGLVFLFITPFIFVLSELIKKTTTGAPLKSLGLAITLSIAFVAVAAQFFTNTFLPFKQTILIFWLLFFLTSVYFVIKSWENSWLSIRRNSSSLLSLTSLSFLLLFLIIAVDIFFSINGDGALYPPLACDESLLHLSLPFSLVHSDYLSSCWWVRAPWHPLLVHHFYSALMSFSDFFGGRVDLVPRVSNILLLAALGGSVYQILSLHRTLFFLLLFLCFPIVQFSMKVAYLDLTLTLWIISLTVMVIRYIQTQVFFYFLLATAFASLAFATKHMGAMFMLPAVMFLIGYDVFNSRKILNIKNILYSSGLVVFILGLFYFRNYKFTGQPLFPFLKGNGSLFLWDQVSTDGINQAISQWQGEGSIFKFIQIFFDISSDPFKYTDTGIYWIGPLAGVLLAGAIAFHFLTNRRNVNSFLLLTSSMAIYFLWMYSSPVIRYLLPFLSLVTLYFLFNFNFIDLRIKKKFNSALNFILIFILTYGVFLSNKLISRGKVQLPPVTEAEVESFMFKTLPNAQFIKYIQKNIQEEEVVYSVLDECQKLVYPFLTIGDWFGGAGYHKILFQKSVTLRDFFSSFNVRYILINEAKFKNFGGSWSTIKIGPTETQIFSDYAKCLKTISVDSNNQDFVLYEINHSDPQCYNQDLKNNTYYKELVKNFPKSKNWSSNDSAH